MKIWKSLDEASLYFLLRVSMGNMHMTSEIKRRTNSTASMIVQSLFSYVLVIIPNLVIVSFDLCRSLYRLSAFVLAKSKSFLTIRNKMSAISPSLVSLSFLS